MAKKVKREVVAVKQSESGEYLPKIRVSAERKRIFYAALDIWREQTGIQDLGISAFIRDALDRRAKELGAG